MPKLLALALCAAGSIAAAEPVEPSTLSLSRVENWESEKLVAFPIEDEEYLVSESEKSKQRLPKFSPDT